MPKRGILDPYRGLLPAGLTIIEDTEGLGEFDINSLELLPIREDWSQLVSGIEVRMWAQAQGANLSLKDGKRLLDRPNEIPQELRQYWIALAGTLVCDGSGDLHIPCLVCDEGRWGLIFHWVEGDWYSIVRLVRPQASPRTLKLLSLFGSLDKESCVGLSNTGHFFFPSACNLQK